MCISARVCRLRNLLCIALVFSQTPVPLSAQSRRTPGGGRTNAPTVVADPGARYGVDVGSTPISSNNGQNRHAEDEGKLEFRSQSVLVQVPTVVTDHAGHHVAGLTKNDFKIFENGKEQTITVCEEITAKNASKLELAHKVNDNTFTNLGAAAQETPHTVVIVAIDAVNTPFLDQSYGRKELIKYLSQHLTAGQPIQVAYIGQKGLKSLSGLTYDSETLISTLKKVSGEVPALQGIGQDAQARLAADAPTSSSALLPEQASPVDTSATGADSPFQAGRTLQDRYQAFVDGSELVEASYQQSQAIETTLNSFFSIALSMSGIPGKKALIWATAGFPFYLDSPSAIPLGNLGPLYERTMQALNDAQISVYPVDVRGLVNYSPNAQAENSGNFTGPQQTRQIINRSWLQQAQVGTLQDFAEMTGGKAFYNSNDVAGGFRQAVDDASSYYLLGYYLDTHNDKSGWRKLKVSVDKKDVQARARSGFLVTNTTMNPEASHQRDEKSALSSPYDSTAIPLTVQVGSPTAAGDKKKVEFAYHVPANGVLIEGTHNAYDLDFMVEARQKDQPVNGSGKVAKGSFAPDALAKVKSDGIYFRNSLELPPGEYQVRFLVRDNLSGRIGTVSAPVTVN